VLLYNNTNFLSAIESPVACLIENSVVEGTHWTRYGWYRSTIAILTTLAVEPICHRATLSDRALGIVADAVAYQWEYADLARC